MLYVGNRGIGLTWMRVTPHPTDIQLDFDKEVLSLPFSCAASCS